MKLKVWTVVGTRPEIIRLSQTIKLFDQIFDHQLIHTGQNSGKNMSDVFFEDLDLREPDHFLGVSGSSLGLLLGDIFSKFGNLMEKSRPDAVVVLGDTNSALVTILARRLGVATYHLEAGNRAFDARVPEETNRKIIDHSADFNLAYNSYSYQNLLNEGLHPSRLFITGSPMLEVIEYLKPKIAKSNILRELNLTVESYLVGSFHRQENVDGRYELRDLVDFGNRLSSELEMPLVLPLHPRTKSKLEDFGYSFDNSVKIIEPLGIVNYLALQASSYATVSDSGTLAEESDMLGFVGISAREATERPESLQIGGLSLVGKSVNNCIEAIEISRLTTQAKSPEGYQEKHFSLRVANIVSSTARRRSQLTGDYRQY